MRREKERGGLRPLPVPQTGFFHIGTAREPAPYVGELCFLVRFGSVGWCSLASIFSSAPRTLSSLLSTRSRRFTRPSTVPATSLFSKEAESVLTLFSIRPRRPFRLSTIWLFSRVVERVSSLCSTWPRRPSRP